MDHNVYLDHSATTPVDPEVVDAMMPFLAQGFGNPSSTHRLGREARIAIEQAREIVADFIGAHPSEIVFTSGGTESNNLAIVGGARGRRTRGSHILTCRAEHHAVLRSAQALEDEGYEIGYVPCDSQGMIHPVDVGRCIREDTILLSIMHCNNEVGTINPIEDIARTAHAGELLMHTDAVQSYGKIPLDVRSMGVDMLSLSAHKCYGPKGVGALFVRQGVTLGSMVKGGGQERSRRAGTENVAGIVGLGKATEVCRRRMDNDAARLKELQNYLWKAISREVPGIVLHGHPECRLPGHLSLSFPQMDGEAVAAQLDLRGFCVSTGSACTSGAVTISHVLEAMGTNRDQAKGAVRITLGRETKKSELDQLLALLHDMCSNN